MATDEQYRDTEEGTAAVLFDPFADDDEYDEIALPQGDSTLAGGMQALLNDLGKLRDQSRLGEQARQESLNIFKQNRTAARRGRVTADGMVELPFVQLEDPEKNILSEAQISEKLKEKNIAPPILAAGDIVANQYEIAGVIAHGGMGWIYLAKDNNVSGRWVILKGMIDLEHEHNTAISAAEREFLADINHPNIVKIYNFVDDPRVAGGFIVMEYIGGPNLKERKRLQPDGVYPIDIAIGYILEILPALEYLHSRGVVYNDLKPENIVITEEQVKLIDLGAVTSIGAFGFIYGTKGFQAPEVPTEGPSVASDIYTVGRTLAAMTVKLPVENGAYLPGIPNPTQEPLFRNHLAFYRLLLRCTHEDPKQRFESVYELVTQLYGVLREILAVRDQKQFPALHSLFSPQRRTFGTKHQVFRTDQIIDGVERNVRINSPEIVSALPVPLIDSSDPGATLLSGTSYAEPGEALEALRQAMYAEENADSVEIPLGIVRLLLDMGLISEARSWLDSLENKLQSAWRFQWYSGLTDLLLEDYHAAQAHFNNVLTILPGESAPKFALAATDELILQQLGRQNSPLLGEDIARATATLNIDLEKLDHDSLYYMDDTWGHVTDDAVALRFHCMRLYGLVWATNPTTVSSAFGLARQLMAENLKELAVATLDRVPQASRYQRMAQLTTVLQLISGDPATLTEEQIRNAAQRLSQVPTSDSRVLQIRIAILGAALKWLRRTKRDHADAPGDLFTYPFTERGLRLGLAGHLRRAARLSPFARQRYVLVDMANAIRPRTWF
ncbi:MAG: tetratricopeptide repeat protein [Corynebacterium sp.]|nr:tetratricopeptide repeat protein [Corynebacterium sp.]